jgi:hypothetical protein
MCCDPLGAGTETVRQGDPALAGVDVELEVVELEVVELEVVELELLPHPAITTAAAMIGHALRTGRKESRSPHGDGRDRAAALVCASLSHRRGGTGHMQMRAAGTPTAGRARFCMK